MKGVEEMNGLANPILAFSFSEIWDNIVDFFQGKQLFEWGINLFNKTLEVLYALLGVNPTEGTYKEVWSVVTNIYDVFLTIGTPLLIVFFIYGYCRDTIDIRAELQIEATVKMFIRLILSVTLLNGALTWTSRFFGWAISLLGVTETSTISLDSGKLSQTLADSSQVIVGFIFGIVFLLVSVAASVIMIWTCLGRFLNLYVLIPFAPIALSTLAAGGGAAQTGYSYIKSLLFYIFEIVVLGIVIAVAPAFMKGFSIKDAGETEMLVAVEALVKMLTIAAGLKGSESVVKHALNL